MKNEIGVVAYSPMQAGLLTGKFDISKVALDDWRRKDKMFQEPYLSQALKFVNKLKPIAEKHGKTVGHVALAWVLHNPAITAAIVGARNKTQSKENVIAADLVLSADEINLIKKLLYEMNL